MNSGKRPFNKDEGKKFAQNCRHTFFLGSNAGNHFNFKLQNREIEVFPEIMSTDPQYLTFCTQLVNNITKLNLEKGVLDNGFFDSHAISTNFQELNTVAGHNMSPATYAVIDNRLLRSSMFLNDSFDTVRDEEIFREFMAVRYSIHDESQGKISRISSSVFPFFSKDINMKAQHLTLLLKNGDNLLDLLATGKLTEAFNKYKVLVSMVDVYRSQADSFSMVNGQFKPKPREVNDIEYSISGGKLGKRFTADKRVYINGRELAGKAAMRARTAFGFSNPLNTVFTAGFEGYRHYSDHKFHMTYKHTDRSSILNKIRKFDNALPVDVTQYDQSIPLYLMEKWIELSPFNERAKKILNLMINAPMLYRGVSESANPYYSGNPLDLDYFNQFRGLISGLFSTSSMGKDFFTFASLIMLDRCYGDVKGNVEKILLWEHPVYAISNMGDDTNIHSNGDIFTNWVKKQLETSKSGLSTYFKVDIEDGFKFLGNVGYIKDGMKYLCGDVGTYLKNMLVPERSIGSSHREFGVYGLLMRREVYQDNPSFGIVDEAFMKTFRDSFKENWLDYMNKHLVMPTDRNLVVRSQADLEVILDPSKLHYKYSESDLSAGVTEILEEKISIENTKLAIKLLF